MPSQAALIINADDLGIHPRTNQGIFDSFDHGVLTSATLLVTTPFLEETAREVRRRRLPVGLHLSLTLGKALAPHQQLPDIVDAAGNMMKSASHFMLLSGPNRARPAIYQQIHREFDAQFSRARDEGIALTHVDSHQHVHMNPHIFTIVEELAGKYGVSKIRFSREPLLAFEITTNLWVNLQQKNVGKLLLARAMARRIRPRLGTSDWFFGLMYSGRFTPRAFGKLVAHIGRAGGRYEIGIHPGHPVEAEASVYPNPGVDAFIKSPHRETELRLLTDPGVRQEIVDRGIRLMSFADLH